MSTEKIIPAEIQVIDSHTGGEPTRMVVEGWPQPAGANMTERLADLKANADHVRYAVVNEPRGHNAIVGALLTPPVEEGSVTGVVYFNDVGYLGMCGHATIGVVESLRWQGQIGDGTVKLDTPVGTVSAELKGKEITIANVASYVYKQDVEFEVPGLGTISGDIAWGGNWFFMCNNYAPEISIANLDQLMNESKAIRQAMIDQGITGKDGGEVDHIEFFGAPTVEGAHSRNFVLCPGNAYDRSPCGTGTSAKMACLEARGKLAPGQKWIQESICGSTYEGWIEIDEEGTIFPFVRSQASVTGKNTLIFQDDDPFRLGI